LYIIWWLWLPSYGYISIIPISVKMNIKCAPTFLPCLVPQLSAISLHNFMLSPSIWKKQVYHKCTYTLLQFTLQKFTLLHIFILYG
jgi:hypothetical protein